MLVIFILIAFGAISCYGHPDSIVRSCRLTDYQCLQNNFAANSNCSRLVSGFIPDEYVVEEFRYETPYSNATYIENGLVVKNNHRCFFTEFFFNVEANSALISADCPGLDIRARRTMLVHRTRQQDAVYRYDVRAYYPLVRLTMDIKNAGAIDTCSSFTFGDVTALPLFFITPVDQASANYKPPDESWAHVFERESWSSRAQPVMRYIINSLICDFKCL